MLQFLVSREVILGRLADEGLESGQFALLALEHHVGLRRLGGLLQLLNHSQVLLHLVVDVVRDQPHFLDDLLLEEKFREVFLQFVVQFFERLGGFFRLGLGRATPGGVFFIHLGVLLPDLFDEAVQRLDVLLAGLNDLVDRNPVEPLLRGIGGQLFSQGNVLLGGEAKTVKDALDLHLGRLDTLGNLDFLLTRQQRNLPHLLEVHANRVVKNVQPTLLSFAL